MPASSIMSHSSLVVMTRSMSRSPSFSSSGARGLELLAGAGHDGDGVDVLARELLADERAEHRHRAAAGAHLGHEVRVAVLHVLDPAGAAGGEHRQLRARFDLLEKLRRLLHDREVGREVGVVHHVGAEAAQRGDELAGARAH